MPAVLRMMQRAVLHRWRATDEDLYREVAALIEATPALEIVVAGCGTGETTAWLAQRTGASLTGVDPDAGKIRTAEARGARAGPPVHYQVAPLDDLPHETGVFDVAIGEPPLSAAGERGEGGGGAGAGGEADGDRGAAAADVDFGDRARRARSDRGPARIAAAPTRGVEADDARCRTRGTAGAGLDRRRRPAAARARPVAHGAPPLLTLRQKAQIVSRAWRRWGWRAARGRRGAGDEAHPRALARARARLPAAERGEVAPRAGRLMFCPDCGTWNRGAAVICVRCAHELPELPDAPAEKPDDELDALRRATGGRYRIYRRLATGGMASVYAARHAVLGRSLVIKVLLAHLARDSGDAGALPPRGGVERAALPSAHLLDPRLRRGGADRLPRDALPRRRLARRPDRAGAERDDGGADGRVDLGADRDGASTTRTATASCTAT